MAEFGKYNCTRWRKTISYGDRKAFVLHTDSVFETVTYALFDEKTNNDMYMCLFQDTKLEKARSLFERIAKFYGAGNG